ncbi:MAG: GNAT family N-acetyltransferase [Deltaproteobacteria bacterium]
MAGSYKFKIATEEGEFEQIHELNYETFVEEIPQHAENERKRLVDKFHDENTYIICLDEGHLLGMLAVRDRRPFSLDQKIPGLDSYLPHARSVCEIRLLSVRKERRHRKVILGLFNVLARYCEEKSYDLALISGNVAQQRLYHTLGFKPFGPRVGGEGAMYQPMYLTPGNYYGIKERMKLLSRMEETAPGTKEPVSMLPGPVDISPHARAAMNGTPVSHRSGKFVEDLNRVKGLLCELAGAGFASILMGSGTLANDAVAARLSLKNDRGLVLSNGEFGERLIDHASRWGLSFKTVETDWGESFDYEEIERTLDCNTGTKWLWAVHSETSTGVLNDAGILKEICIKRGVELCLDCISSIGTVPLDLSGVHMATGVSGKGLRSYPGISFVLHNSPIEPAYGKLPRYLDLGLYSGSNPFTFSSNMLYALKGALENLNAGERYSRISELALWVRERLRDTGFLIVAKKGHESPSLITVQLPGWLDSSETGLRLERSGFLLNWRSVYLRERNWIQIALMGECTRERIMPLLGLLGNVIKPRRRAL